MWLPTWKLSWVAAAATKSPLSWPGMAMFNTDVHKTSGRDSHCFRLGQAANFDQETSTLTTKNLQQGVQQQQMSRLPERLRHLPEVLKADYCQLSKSTQLCPHSNISKRELENSLLSSTNELARVPYPWAVLHYVCGGQENRKCFFLHVSLDCSAAGTSAYKALSFCFFLQHPISDDDHRKARLISTRHYTSHVVIWTE